MIFRRMVNFLIAIANQMRWKWRFKHFGWRSRLHSCDMLTNPGLMSIGKKVLIRKSARLEVVNRTNSQTPKLIIGDGTVIQFYFHCGASESIIIGEDVLIAGHVYITDHDHVFDDPSLSAMRCGKLKSSPVVIEDGCWLGEGCMVLKGVTIGARSVVAANAVVTRDVPPGVIVAGTPAKVIKKMNVSYLKEDTISIKRSSGDFSGNL